ncbi:methyl-accepting chemotaxis protein [Acidisoma sp. L85]|uniref:methyl-accepting chemotaxis protein n=1 Tax=Acidisoma sp. L85 TaxID=1641850 RepID=UPI00131B8DAE|nr:methyl-accepting chemotaxis protein [Acidisoma sp. L85]
MTIATRLLLGFGVSILLLVGIGLFSLWEISSVRYATETIVARDLAAYRALGQIAESQSNMNESRRAAVLEAMMHPSSAVAIHAVATRWDAQADTTESLLDQAITTTATYEQTALDPGRRSAWQQTAELLRQARLRLQSLRAGSDKQFDDLARNDAAGVMAVEPSLISLRADFVVTLRQAEDALNVGVEAGQRRIELIYNTSRTSLIVAAAGAALLCLLMTFLIQRSIVRPLARYVRFAEVVGQGDLTTPPTRAGHDELGRLGGTLNAMVTGLRQLAVQTRDVTRNLNAAAAEIRASTQEQAASVEQQLAAIQETAATADEITHSGTRIARRAEEVIVAAEAATQRSASGLQAVVETARAMELIRDQGGMVAGNIVALSEKTQAIGDIIMVVNDIAERSHLLALNAAIEAAAAGEKGRSFAVVASEMKILADQAKEATVQVRSILGEIQRGINTSVMLAEEQVKRVASGKERTDLTHRAIEEITGSVRESVQTFQQIVASTNQQQIGVEQVMTALQSIRQASQQTAAGTRQLDSAAGNLTELSHQLVALADRYRV